jgi:N-acyl-D-aspartate/D-glutamate deacylase
MGSSESSYIGFVLLTIGVFNLYEILIKNGNVVDGTGSPWYKADIGIEKDMIIDIGNLHSGSADKIIDAKGLIVSPGFIDIHSHSEITLLVNGRAESKIRQGITTDVNGNCGHSAAPIIGLAAERIKVEMKNYGLDLDWSTFEEYSKKLEKQGISINAPSFLGHTDVRQAILGNEERAPSDVELEEMKAIVDQAMKEGALGLSTGLESVPGGYANTEEIIELCKIVAKYGGIYSTHQRNRDTHYEQSTMEAIEIGKKAGVRIQLSHFVPRYPGHDKMPILLWMVDQARREDVDVTFDVITPTDAPRELLLKLRDGYHWAEQGLTHQLIPPWGLQGTVEEVLEKLRNPEMRKRFRNEHIPQWKLFGCPKGKFKILGIAYDFPNGVSPKWEAILINNCVANPQLIGKTLDEIAKIKKLNDPWDAAIEIVVDEINKTKKTRAPINILGASTAERDSIMALRHPVAMVTSDRAALVPYGLLARTRSPNSYGAFARIFRKYVRDRGIFTLEEAIRKMTSLPANSLRLYDRGIIKIGAKADIAVFDSNKIADNATIEEPNKYADGVKYVLVNGVITLENGEHSGAMAGKVLKLVQ